MERCSDCERIRTNYKPQEKVTAHWHQESKGRIRGLSIPLAQDRMLVYPMLFPSQQLPTYPSNLLSIDCCWIKGRGGWAVAQILILIRFFYFCFEIFWSIWRQKLSVNTPPSAINIPSLLRLFQSLLTLGCIS